jgi:hypothetical protein
MTDKRVVIAEFENQLEAEIAIGHLESAGIAASLIKDDAGGMLPSLQQTAGVQVLVSESERERAVAVLEEKMQ